MTMAEGGDRRLQAEAYVAGRLSPAEREAAEHLLELDGGFRLAVLDAGERLGLLPRGCDPNAPDWNEVRRLLCALPHMVEWPGQGLGAPRHETPVPPDLASEATLWRRMVHFLRRWRP